MRLKIKIVNNLSAFLIAVFSVFPDGSSAETLGYLPGSPVYLGGGFNIISPGKPYPSCVVADRECQNTVNGSISCIAPKGTSTTPQSAPKYAPSTSFSVREIRTKSEFLRELNVSASVSGSYGIFSGGASYSLHSIDDIDENSVSWSITARSDYGSFSLGEPILRPDLRGKSPRTIVDTCGPQYVSEVDRGVLVSVLYTFHSKSEKHLKEVSVGISAGLNAGAWSVGGSANYNEFVEELLKRGQVSVRVFAIGGEGVSSLSEIIEKDPTNLTEIKRLLKIYVSNQDVSRAAITSFRTTSIGKLIARPEVDPDFSSYLFFLERINEYRLTIEDYLRTLDEFLINSSDYPEEVGSDLRQLSRDTNCELELINLKAATCRLWTDSLLSLLTDGISGNDATARLLMTHSMFFDEKLVDQIGGSVRGYGLNSFGIVNEEPSSCKIALERTKSTNYLATQLRTGAKSLQNTLSEKSGPACAFNVDTELLSELDSIPKYPFIFRYYFDGFTSSPAAPVGQESLYVQLQEAQSVDFMQVYNEDRALLKHETNRAASSNFGFALPIADKKGSTVALVVQMLSGNTYDIVIEVPL